MKASKNKQKQNNAPTASGKYRPVAVVGTVATLIIGLGIAAYAANTLLHGHVRFTEHTNQSPPAVTVTKGADQYASPKTVGSSPKSSSDLVDKYGTAANSPAVAAAIRKAERRPDAKAASDASEALQHGVWKPGADPMLAIMHGYVPPGMSQQQGAMLFNSLPNNLKMSHMLQPGSSEWVAKMAGEPADPVAGLPSGVTQEGVRSANQKMVEGYMRERFGPVYVPPLHRDHNAVQQTNSKLATDTFFHKDNQMSRIEPEFTRDFLDPVTGESHPPRVYNPAVVSHTIREMTDGSGNIVAQYGYDPFGRQTKISGSGPDADFGYQGYYVHQRSGLDLTRTRAYSPVLGRFLNRDPIEELGGINLYAYVQNNPISRQDPSGEMWKTCCKDPTVDCPTPGKHCPVKLPADGKCAKDSVGGRTYFIRAFRRGYQKCVWSDNGDPEGGTYACEPTGTPKNCP